MIFYEKIKYLLVHHNTFRKIEKKIGLSIYICLYFIINARILIYCDFNVNIAISNGFCNWNLRL